tara:strand:+ start:29010 stop:30296 length:1287 start_codon:yes stop_codon:yes gene_type:complete
VLLGGCTFNTSTSANLDDGGATPVIDGGPFVDSPDAIAPADCPDDIHIEVRVNGVDAPSSAQDPFVHTIVGDTVELSAAGTCTRSGTIQYNWVIGPATSQVEATALPNLQSETITVYSTGPQGHDVRLEISDGTTTEQVTIFAFDAHGFAELKSYTGNRVRDLSAGADYLWVGADNGAHRGTLATPLLPFELVNDIYAGDSLPGKLQVHATSDGARVWFGSDDGDGRAYALILADDAIASFATIDGAKTRDIDEAAQGIRFATDNGVVLAADSETFVLERDDDSAAVSDGPTGAWAGKDELYPLPNGAPIDLFNGQGDIKAIADDGTLLWIASKNDGIVSFQNGAIVTSYTPDNSGLPSDDVRDFAIDSDLDIWVATASGASRFKRDRQVWIPLAGSGNLDAIEIDEADGRRVIFVGGGGGLFSMSAF